MLALLAGIGLTAYQIGKRVEKYLSHPVKVNLEVSYEKTITFPAVTICNFNRYM